MNAIRLPAPGTRVGSCDGLSVRRNGTVITHVTNRWGTTAMVLMDDGRIDWCNYLVKMGIGWEDLTVRAGTGSTK